MMEYGCLLPFCWGCIWLSQSTDLVCWILLLSVCMWLSLSARIVYRRLLCLYGYPKSVKLYRLLSVYWLCRIVNWYCLLSVWYGYYRTLPEQYHVVSYKTPRVECQLLLASMWCWCFWWTRRPAGSCVEIALQIKAKLYIWVYVAMSLAAGESINIA